MCIAAGRAGAGCRGKGLWGYTGQTMPASARAPEFPGVRALVLAAGQGRRMTGPTPKLLLPMPSRPGSRPARIETILERSVSNALEAGAGRVTVVLGPHRRRFLRVLAPWAAHPRLEVVWNRSHASGRSTSIRAGILQGSGEMNDLLVLCADQPGIGQGLLRRLLAFHLEGGYPASHPVRRDGAKGYPVVWSGRLLPELLERLEGDRGCLEVLREQDGRVGRLPLRPEEEALQGDLDTLRDYREWRWTTA